MARFTSTTHQPDHLIIGGRVPARTAVKTLALGQNLARGAVLGVVLGAAVVAAAAANTGNGTIGAVAVGPSAQPGVYQAVCIEPAANGGTFVVYDPAGVVVGRAVVGAEFASQLTFTIADGATDFVAGDRFTITVADGETVKLALAAATDSSNTPRYVLAEACDATDAAAECLVYTEAEVDEAALTLGTGITAAAAKAALKPAGIVVTDTLPA